MWLCLPTLHGNRELIIRFVLQAGGQSSMRVQVRLAALPFPPSSFLGYWLPLSLT